MRQQVGQPRLPSLLDKLYTDTSPLTGTYTVLEPQTFYYTDSLDSLYKLRGNCESRT